VVAPPPPAPAAPAGPRLTDAPPPPPWLALGLDPDDPENPMPVGTWACRGFRVTHAVDAAGLGRVSVTRGDGTPVLGVEGPVLTNADGTRQNGDASYVGCLDATGDGTPEVLVVKAYYQSDRPSPELHLYALESPVAREIWTWREGDGGGGIAFLRMTTAPHYQIVGRNHAFVSMPVPGLETDFASTPSFPIVFDLENGKYVARTRKYVELARRERTTMPCPVGARPCALATFAISQLIGDWAQAGPMLVPDEGTRSKLEAALPKLAPLLE
jgi:hypothetical protein